MITNNEELRPKFNEMIDSILRMCYHIYRRRPSCAQLLSEYSKWGIDDSVIRISDDYEKTNELVKTNKCLQSFLF